MAVENPLLSGQGSRMRRELSRNDIGNQARYLLNYFIRDPLQEYDNVPAVEGLQDAGTPAGPPMEHRQDVVRAVKCIGDELDANQRIQNLLAQLPPDATLQDFIAVAICVFKDGGRSWGRVVALFYLAKKMALNRLDRNPLIKAVVNWVVAYIVEHVAAWIIARGGWEAIVEYFGTPTSQVLGVVATAAVACILLVAYHSFKRS